MPASSAPVNALTWPPPLGWQLFDEVLVPAEGGTFTLDPGTDYRIVTPETIAGPVRIRGGRHVVWVGGHISISRGDTRPGATERRAIFIGDHPDEPTVARRIVHLEGLLLDGDDLSEGIDIAAPSAIVQIQNVRVSGVFIRGADDRDGTYPEPTDLNPCQYANPSPGALDRHPGSRRWA